jgi:hypothetical protein
MSDQRLTHVREIVRDWLLGWGRVLFTCLGLLFVGVLFGKWKTIEDLFHNYIEVGGAISALILFAAFLLAIPCVAVVGFSMKPLKYPTEHWFWADLTLGLYAWIYIFYYLVQTVTNPIEKIFDTSFALTDKLFDPMINFTYKGPIHIALAMLTILLGSFYCSRVVSLLWKNRPPLHKCPYCQQSDKAPN